MFRNVPGAPAQVAAFYGKNNNNGLAGGFSYVPRIPVPSEPASVSNAFEVVHEVLVREATRLEAAAGTSPIWANTFLNEKDVAEKTQAQGNLRTRLPPAYFFNALDTLKENKHDRPDYAALQEQILRMMEERITDPEESNQVLDAGTIVLEKVIVQRLLDREAEKKRYYTGRLMSFIRNAMVSSAERDEDLLNHLSGNGSRVLATSSTAIPDWVDDVFLAKEGLFTGNDPSSPVTKLKKDFDELVQKSGLEERYKGARFNHLHTDVGTPPTNNHNTIESKFWRGSKVRLQMYIMTKDVVPSVEDVLAANVNETLEQLTAALLLIV